MSNYGYALQNPIRYFDPNGEAATAAWCFGGPVACVAGLVLAGGAMWMATQSEDSDSGSSAGSRENCCTFYRDVYQSNFQKHGSQTRSGPKGPISPEPTDPQITLTSSVPVGGNSRLGSHPLTGEVVLFRLHWTDEVNCVRYWHGYVVGQRDLTPQQWKAGRDAGFPNWPRKPR